LADDDLFPGCQVKVSGDTRRQAGA
jgi:hypothetical protein